eukprot:TRINITY_DN10506_c0_g1_i1.p1 TRINITY_DN10506_c0_g1~~TRINITY_DN10506_c0_g1_i1.p1  ORF type:complete len:740 (-),score=185.33 TRINITY_DN10506_c0_g1_i1:43-2004(-)
MAEFRAEMNQTAATRKHKKTPHSSNGDGKKARKKKRIFDEDNRVDDEFGLPPRRVKSNLDTDMVDIDTLDLSDAGGSSPKPKKLATTPRAKALHSKSSAPSSVAVSPKRTPKSTAAAAAGFAVEAHSDLIMQSVVGPTARQLAAEEAENVRQAQRYIGQVAPSYAATELRSALYAAADTTQGALAVADALKVLPPPIAVVTEHTLRAIKVYVKDLCMRTRYAVLDRTMKCDEQWVRRFTTAVEELQKLAVRLSLRLQHTEGAADMLILLRAVTTMIPTVFSDDEDAIVVDARAKLMQSLMSTWSEALTELGPAMHQHNKQRWIECAVSLDPAGYLDLPNDRTMHHSSRVAALRTAPSLQKFIAALKSGVSQDTALLAIAKQHAVARIQCLMHVGLTDDALILLAKLPSSTYVRHMIYPRLILAVPQFVFDRASVVLHDALNAAADATSKWSRATAADAAACGTDADQLFAAWQHPSAGRHDALLQRLVQSDVADRTTELDALLQRYAEAPDDSTGVAGEHVKTHEQLQQLLMGGGGGGARHRSDTPWSKYDLPDIVHTRTLDFQLNATTGVPLNSRYMEGYARWLSLARSCAALLDGGEGRLNALHRELRATASMLSDVPPVPAAVVACREVALVLELAMMGKICELETLRRV